MSGTNPCHNAHSKNLFGQVDKLAGMENCQQVTGHKTAQKSSVILFFKKCSQNLVCRGRQVSHRDKESCDP